MRNMKKRIVAMGLMATMSLGLATSASAATAKSGIGKLTLTTTKATGTTTISTAAHPATGFAGYVKVTATNTDGKKKTKVNTLYSSQTSVTVKKSEVGSGKSNLKKASSVHEELYFGVEQKEFTKKLSLSI